MIINSATLLELAPIKNMLGTKEVNGKVTHGMSEAGYDIRIKQGVNFYPAGTYAYIPVREESSDGDNKIGFTRTMMTEPSIIVSDPENGFYDIAKGTRFTLASAIEEFQMPENLVGIVHDKSSWARKGLSVFNTVIEPGFIGGLTLELVYHGNGELIIPAGSGIAQVIFHELKNTAKYNGKYQHQGTDPTPARDS